MNFHCEKLCSGECCDPLTWALSSVIAQPNARVFLAYNGNQANAFRAVVDPDEITSMLSLAEASRGDRYEFVVSGNTIEWCEWVSGKKRLITIAIWTMQQASEMLLAIMRTPADPSSRGACEKILRGEL